MKAYEQQFLEVRHIICNLGKRVQYRFSAGLACNSPMLIGYSCKARTNNHYPASSS